MVSDGYFGSHIWKENKPLEEKEDAKMTNKKSKGDREMTKKWKLIIVKDDKVDGLYTMTVEYDTGSLMGLPFRTHKTLLEDIDKFLNIQEKSMKNKETKETEK